jgi:hypothetical protein
MIKQQNTQLKELVYKITIRLARYWKNIDKTQYYSHLDKMLSIALKLENSSLKPNLLNHEEEF